MFRSLKFSQDRLQNKIIDFFKPIIPNVVTLSVPLSGTALLYVKY